MIYQVKKTCVHYFDGLIPWLEQVADPRKHRHYSIGAIVQGGISLFLFREDSRNALNNDRKEKVFRDNYENVFGLELAHMDTVDDVFRMLVPAELENVRKDMVTTLIRQRVLESGRYRSGYLVAVDGTGVVSYDHPHCECCLRKTSKKGTTTYFHHVLEAKLITPSGMSLSIGSEWINNGGKTEFDKQDCEREAFKRLAQKIKDQYPRLGVIIVADGLYPWEGFFQICKQNRWNYIVTLQDKSLKSLQEEIQWEKRFRTEQQRQVFRVKNKKQVLLHYHWLKGLLYHGHQVNWVECVEETKNAAGEVIKKQRFVHLSDLETDGNHCVGISDSGRLRQKIENEGFNAQKHHGYNLEHKFSRNDFPAMKNYYQCLQIAHIINQLVVLSRRIVCLLEQDTKLTVKYLYKRMIALLLEVALDTGELENQISRRFQVRLI